MASKVASKLRNFLKNTWFTDGAWFLSYCIVQKTNNFDWALSKNRVRRIVFFKNMRSVMSRWCHNHCTALAIIRGSDGRSPAPQIHKYINGQALGTSSFGNFCRNLTINLPFYLSRE